MKKYDNITTLEAKYVKESFDLIAPTYDRGRKVWRELLKHAASYDIILDAGCGTGRSSLYLAKIGSEVICLDLSYNMCKIAYKRAHRHRILTIYVINAHIAFLPIRKSSIEACVLLATIHHIPRRNRRIKVLTQIKECLKNNGLVILSCWYRYRPRNLFLSLKWIIVKRLYEWGDALVPWKTRRKTTYRFYHFCTKKEIKEEVSRAGFHVIECFLWSPSKRLIKDNVVVIARRP